MYCRIHVLRYCCKNGERVKKIHMNAERCIADNARIPSNAFHPMQCEAGGRVLHWMQCITRDVCNISNTPRGMNVYFLYSRAILAAKTLLLKIGMNKIKKSHLSFHDFFSKKVMHWGFYVPHFHFTIFFEWMVTCLFVSLKMLSLLTWCYLHREPSLNH